MNFNLITCEKPFAFIYPFAEAVSFFCLIIYYGIFNTFGPLTEAQRSGVILFCLGHLLLLLVIPVASYSTNFQKNPNCSVAVCIQIGFILSFILMIISAIQFGQETTIKEMTEYFKFYYTNSEGKIPPYLELYQNNFQNCCGLSGYHDYMEFWTKPVKIFSLPDTCCRNMSPGCLSNLNPDKEYLFQNEVHSNGCFPLGVESMTPFYQQLISTLSIVPWFVVCEIIGMIVTFNIYFCLERRENATNNIQNSIAMKNNSTHKSLKDKPTPLLIRQKKLYESKSKTQIHFDGDKTKNEDQLNNNYYSTSKNHLDSNQNSNIFQQGRSITHI